MRPISSSDKILAYSFVASLLLNFGWMFWVGQSKIFGSTRTLTDLHPAPIKIFQPIIVKPVVKPSVALPPPPPPPVRPRIRETFKPLAPMVRPPQAAPSLPRMARTQPPPLRPVHTQATQIQAAQTQLPQTAPAQSLPLQALPAHPHNETRIAMREPLTKLTGPNDFSPTNLTAPSNPGSSLTLPKANQVKASEVQQPEIRQPETKQPETKQPEARQPEVQQPEVKHAEFKRPGWVAVDVQGATNLSDYVSPEVSDDDGVAGKSVMISWTVNEKGRAENVHVTQSSGSSEVDRKCEESIRSMRFQPAIQDHYFQEAHMHHEFGF